MAFVNSTVNFEDLFDFSPESSSHKEEETPALSSSLDWKGSRTVKDLLEDLPEVLADNYNGAEGGGQEDAPRSKRGRKPGQKNLKTDMKSKLERSRQSARECRARKKLRYQYLDDLILEREKANLALREELSLYQEWCHELDKGRVPDDLKEYLRKEHPFK